MVFRCYHGPLLYEAKCVKTKSDNGNYTYFVHYQGWNKNWDEWVNDTRILKANAENHELKDKLLKEHTASVREKKKAGKTSGPLGTPFQKEGGKKSSGGSANTSRASTPVSERSFKIGTSSSLKRSLGDEEKSNSSHEDEALARRSAKRARLSESMFEDADTWRFKIEIPEELKYVLVSDMELITVKKTLFGLPAKFSVSGILNEYVKYMEKSQPESAHGVSEVMQGIKDIFDEIVGPQLLYTSEKPQYNEKVAKDEQPPSATYGSAHLLRLMVKIGPLLNRSSFDNSSESNVNHVEGIICDFLSYMESNRSRLFTSKNYTENAEDYEVVVQQET